MIRNNLSIAKRVLISTFFLLPLGCATGRLQNIDVLMRQQNWSAAKTALEETVQRNPRDGEAHLLLAEVYAELGQVSQMQTVLARLRNFSPRYHADADYLTQKYWIQNFNLGNVRFDERLFNEAVICFLRTTQLDSSNLNGWQRYGDALFKARRFDEAEGAYRNALALSPYNAFIKNNLAEIYFIWKSYDQTIRLCNEILELDENDVDALQRRAYSYEATGKFKASEDDFLEVALLQPSARLLADFGLLYFNEGDYVRAITRFEDALSFASDKTLLFRHLGEANYRIRNYQDMARWYKKVVANNPDDVVGWKNLALAYEALGEKENLAQARHFINRITSTN